MLRERLFLAFGLGSALVLVLAAFATGGDPESAGRAELVSTAAKIAEAVKAEWKDWPTRAEWAPNSPDGKQRWEALIPSPLRWKEGRLPFIDGHELVRESGPGHEVFDALFAQSEQVELAKNDPAGALDLVREALEKTKDPARRAEGRLRAVQLAVKAAKPAWAREEYELACKDLDGSERKGDVSYRLLLALAVSPVMEAEQDASLLAKELHALESSGRLAWILPPLTIMPRDVSNGAWGCEEDPSTETLLTLVRARADIPHTDAELEWASPGEPRFAADFRMIRVADAMRAQFGDVPTIDANRFALRRTPGGFLCYWQRIMPGAMTGGFVCDTAIRGIVQGLVSQAALVPDGFVVDIDPPASKAQAVREHDSLDGDFGFTVKHVDPDGWIRRSAAKQRFFRAALLVLALLSAAAGVATFRALRRERTLATLKTDFVANVSHELRTPLSSILLLSENLETGRVTSESDQARYHTLIRREALRLRRLVDDVLDFSRLERGKRLEVHREPMRVDPWLERTAEELAEWAREHALAFAVALSPTSAEAEIDPEALRRALLNLLDNARKHSGGTEVELSSAREGSQLVLSVRDRGRGIPAAEREHVFEPFTRLDGHGSAGAGLGLSIVREIAREHGGTVRALDPDEGPGIVFQMRIPLAEEAGP